MTTLLYMHPSSLEHDAGPGHPKLPARIRAITAMLEREERKGALVGVDRREPPRASREQLERIHGTHTLPRWYAATEARRLPTRGFQAAGHALVTW